LALGRKTLTHFTGKPRSKLRQLANLHAATMWAQAAKTLLLKSLEPYAFMANKDQAEAGRRLLWKVD